MTRELTPKQSLFVLEYLKDLNGTQAAIRAGYSEHAKPVGFYVYFLIDSESKKIFYVGKGKGKRVHAHCINHSKGVIDNAPKFQEISRIKERGNQVIEMILESGMKESDAFFLERVLISKLKNSGLTNISNGLVSNAEHNKVYVQSLISRLTPFDLWEKTIDDYTKNLAISCFGSLINAHDFLRTSLERMARKVSC